MKLGGVLGLLGATLLGTNFGCGVGASQGLGKLGGGSSATTFGISDATFEKIGAQLDNPEQIFAKAGYKPLWTEPQSAVANRLPKGLKTVPKEVRVWEPWFRNRLTNNGKPLSTAELYKAKWAVAMTVANDPACQFKPPMEPNTLVAAVEAARQKGLQSIGITNPSPELVAMSVADASWAWTKSQRVYGDKHPLLDDIERNKKRYPTFREMLSEPAPLDCGRSNLMMIHLFRALAKGSASPAKIGNVYTFDFRSSRAYMMNHSVNGVQISTAGATAHLYYDSTAVGKEAFGMGGLSRFVRSGGPLDKVSMERFTNQSCTRVSKDSPDENRKKIQVVTYNYVLGENWPQFGLGNFDRKACPDYGIYGGGTDYESAKPGKEAFEKYWNANKASISSLERALEIIASGK